MGTPQTTPAPDRRGWHAPLPHVALALPRARTRPVDPNGKLYKRRLRDPYWAGHARQI